MTGTLQQQIDKVVSEIKSSAELAIENTVENNESLHQRRANKYSENMKAVCGDIDDCATSASSLLSVIRHLEDTVKAEINEAYLQGFKDGIAAAKESLRSSYVI